MDNLSKQKFKELNRALKLQAKEYERRLKELNGEAKRIREIQGKSVTKELFDITISQVEKALSELQAWKSNQEGKGQNKIELYKNVPVLISVIIMILSIIFVWLTYNKK